MLHSQTPTMLFLTKNQSSKKQIFQRAAVDNGDDDNESVTTHASTTTSHFEKSCRIPLTKIPLLAEGTTKNVVVGSFYKETADTKTGITLLSVSKDKGGIIIISRISPGSLAAATDLKAGLVIKAINGQDCSNMGLDKTSKLLTGTTGIIVVVAQIAASYELSNKASNAKIIKEDTSTSKVWLVRLHNSRNGPVIIDKVESKSPLRSTEFAAGKIISSVGGKSCIGMNASAVAKVLDKIIFRDAVVVASTDGSTEKVYLDPTVGQLVNDSIPLPFFGIVGLAAHSCRKAIENSAAA